MKGVLRLTGIQKGWRMKGREGLNWKGEEEGNLGFSEEAWN